MSKLDPDVIFNPTELFIHTPMLEQLEKQLHHWLRTGLTGGLVLGNYRIGKTRAIEYISKRLFNRKGEEIHADRMTIAQRDVCTVKSIFRNLCFALDMPINDRTNSDEMASCLTHYFGEKALQNSTKQVVLIVDEMQRLKVNQLNAFAELYDNLAKLKLNMSVFFVGNAGSSKPLLEAISDDRYELLRGRFFTHVYDYCGIRNKNDVGHCLKEFDRLFTKHFLHDDFKKGWRLASLDKTIWSIFETDFRRPLKLKSWAMQYFISTIRILLVDYLPRYDIYDQEALEEMITASIDASGIRSNLVLAA